jgi:hypothetical protein
MGERGQAVIWGGALVAAGVAAFLLPNYYLYLLGLAGVWAIAALGLNLLTGYAGQISIGHAGFVAVGAYTAALLQVKAGVPFLLALPAAGLGSAGNGRFDFGFGLHTGFGNERLKLGAIKLFLDGSLIGRTAALSAPYANAPDTCGLLVKSEATVRAQVEMAHRGGWQVAMHAIGDRAIEVGLNAIAAVMGAEAPRFRPRIEHCGVLRPDLIERLRRLGVVIVTQPRFIFELGDGFRIALGEERLRFTYPFASLRGLPVAFSSDRPVVAGTPLWGIQAAVTQRTASGASYVPAEAITVEEALRWYTLGAAYSAFEEGEKGSLTPGKWADFVVLSTDPLRTDPATLAEEVTVLQTVIGGETVYGG